MVIYLSMCLYIMDFLACIWIWDSCLPEDTASLVNYDHKQNQQCILGALKMFITIIF